MVITSLSNEKIKNYIKLKDKKYRDMTNLFIVEGEHLVIEAYKAGILEEIILEENSNFKLDVKTTYVSKEIIKKISSVLTPSNIYGIAKKRKETEIENRILILDNIQDPGNLGTIIRSALSFNIDTIILSDDSVDLYNPKVLRSAQGTSFHINIIRDNINKVIDELKNKNIPIYVTKVDGGENIKKLTNKEKNRFALVMGNEGNGVNQSILEKADKYIYIEMNEKVESLNVSIATSILLYELGVK